MRRLVPLLLLGSIAGACKCTPDAATAVTLRINNTSQNPIYVDNNDGRMGVQVQRGGLTGFATVDEWLPCEFEACNVVCSSVSSCPPDAGTGTVVMVPPGGTVERQWGGVIVSNAVSACGSLVGGVDCKAVENAPVNESFQAHFCYGLAGSLDPGGDAGVPSPGAVAPGSVLCTDRSFQIQDGVVELSPSRGTTCNTHADCADAGTGTDGGSLLCFNNTCTPVCPANDFPQLGGSWQVSIDDPQNSDYGFWPAPVGSNPMIWSATGVVTSVTYNGGTMIASLATDTSENAPHGVLNVTLPPGYPVALYTHEVISIRIVDNSPSSYIPLRAVVIRDSTGQLLLAADMAQGGPLLSAKDIAPFAVSDAHDIEGCDTTPCGRRVFDGTDFSFQGGLPYTLSPGESVTADTDAGTFVLLNVSNSRFPTPSPACQPKDVRALMPYAIVNQRKP